MTSRLPLVSVMLALLLAACAGQAPRPPAAGSWEEHSQSLRQLTHWDARGKIALRTPTQSESASIHWQHQDAISQLQLNGPLGMAATSLYSDGNTLVIRQGDRSSTWDLADTAALERQTGWNLPLLALPHWIKGIPAPELEVQAMEMGPDPALLLALEQDGWEIRYENYSRYGAWTLPTRLQIQQGDTTVRLIIRDWQVATD